MCGDPVFPSLQRPHCPLSSVAVGDAASQTAFYNSEPRWLLIQPKMGPDPVFNPCQEFSTGD